MFNYSKDTSKKSFFAYSLQDAIGFVLNNRVKSSTYRENLKRLVESNKIVIQHMLSEDLEGTEFYKELHKSVEIAEEVLNDIA